jgi:hypothetical protein
LFLLPFADNKEGKKKVFDEIGVSRFQKYRRPAGLVEGGLYYRRAILSPGK